MADDDSFERRRKEREARRAARKKRMAQLSSVASEVNMEVVERLHLREHLPCVSDCSEPFLDQLKSAFTRTYIPSGSTIVHHGEQSQHIIHVYSGSVEVCTPEGNVVSVLGAHSTFAMNSCVLGSSYEATLKTKTNSIIYKCEQSAIWELLEKFPADNKMILKSIQPVDDEDDEDDALRPLLTHLANYYAIIPADTPSEVTKDVRKDITTLFLFYVRQLDHFEHVSIKFIKRLCDHMAGYKLTSSSTLYKQGASANNVYVLLNGSLATSNGGRQTGTISRLGSWVGFAELTDAENISDIRAQTVSAPPTSDCHLLAINSNHFKQVLQEFPEELQIFQTLSAEVMAGAEKQVQDVEARVNLRYEALRQSLGASGEPRDIDTIFDKRDLLFTFNTMLRRVDLFSTASEEFIMELGEHLQPVVYSDGDVLFKEGDAGDMMIFVQSGFVDVSKNGKHIVRLKPGTFVGEGALLSQGGKRNATVTASGNINAVKLTRDELDSVLESHPKQRVAMLSVTQGRIAQSAIQKLIGTDVGNEQEFRSKLGSILSQAISDKNKGIYKLEKKVRKMQTELDEMRTKSRRLTSDAIVAKRNSRLTRMRLYQMTHRPDGFELVDPENAHSAAASSSAMSTRAIAIRRSIIDYSHELAPRPPRPTFDFGRISDIILMLSTRPRLQDLLKFKAFVRQMDEQWAHGFLEGYGLRALIDCFIRLGDMLYENILAIGGIQVIAFQIIAHIFSLLGTSIYDHNMPLVADYATVALGSFSSLLQEHSLRLVKRVCRERPLEGRKLLQDILSQHRENKERAADPLFHPLAELLEIVDDNGATPIRVTLVRLVNAYISSFTTIAERNEVRAELGLSGWMDAVEISLIECSGDPSYRYLHKLEKAVQQYRDQAQDDRAKEKEVRTHLGVTDINNYTSVTSTINEVLAKRSGAEEETDATLHIMQQLLLIVNDPKLSSIGLPFISKTISAALQLEPSSNAPYKLRNADIRKFIKLKQQQEAAGAKELGAAQTVQAKKLEEKTQVTQLEPAVALEPVAKTTETTIAAKPEGTPAVTPPSPVQVAIAAPPPPAPPAAPGAPPPPGAPPAPGAPPPPGAPPAPGGPPPPPGAPGAAPAGPAAYTGPAPSCKVKPFFWSKLPPFLAKNTIWLSDPVKEKDVPPLNGGQLEEYFAAKSIKKKGADKSEAAAEKPHEPEVIQLLDMKQSTNLSIVLSQFKGKTHNDIMSAVLQCNSNVLSADQLVVLAKYVPNDEETALLRNFAGDANKLGQGEKFFRAILSVPRYKEKVEGFLLKSKFDSRISEYQGDVATIEECYDQIHSSHSLRFLLEVIRNIGNFLNYGGSKGNAIGFKLDTLTKLKTTKSTSESKVSLLHYIAMYLEEEGHVTLQWYKELDQLEPSSKVSLAELKKNLKALSHQLRAVEHELQHCNDAASAAWKSAMNTFVSRARVECSDVEKRMQTLDEKMVKVLKGYALDPNASPDGVDAPTAFILMLNTFKEEWMQAQEDNKRLVRLKKKKAKREAKIERQRLAKEEKLKRMQAAGGLSKHGINKKALASLVDGVVDALIESEEESAIQRQKSGSFSLTRSGKASKANKSSPALSRTKKSKKRMSRSHRSKKQDKDDITNLVDSFGQ